MSLRTMRSIRLQRTIRKTGVVLHEADYPGNAHVEVKRMKLSQDEKDPREIVHVTISVPSVTEPIANATRKRRAPVYR